METPKQIAETIIQLMKQQGLLEHLPEVVEELVSYVQEQDSYVTVESAKELDPQVMDKIIEILHKKLGYVPNVEHNLNPELKSGIRVKITDDQTDENVKAQIEEVFEKKH